MIYLDPCALVKLLVPEAESTALRTYLSAHASFPQVTAELARTEMMRVVRRADPDDADLRVAALELVDRLDQIPLSRELLDAAGAVADPMVRTLDAIHLAAADALGAALEAFVTYDHRLAAAAKSAGMPVQAPGA